MVPDGMLRNTVGLFSGHLTGNALPESITPRDLMVSGVEAMLKRIYVSGILFADNRSQPLTLCGVDPAQETVHTVFQWKINQGRYPIAGRNEILISRATAQALGVHPGDRLWFASPATGHAIDLSVSGVFHTGLESLDQGLAFCPPDRLAGYATVWSAAVFLETGIEAETVIQRYPRQFAQSLHSESWASQMPDLSQIINLEAVSMSIVILLVFGVVAIGIACSFVIFIIRNMREYGILKAMGVSTGEMAALIVAKVLMVNLLACGVGLRLGGSAALLTAHVGGIDISSLTSHNRYFSVSGVILPRLTALSLWAPPVTALCFGLLAAVWPACLVAGKKAADILRII